MMKRLVIYDADPDGFGCLYASSKNYGVKDTDYMEILHGSLLPPEVFNYDSVHIYDLSFTDEEYWAMLQDDVQVTVIDHHPSAQEAIEKYRLNPNEYNTKEAACVQVWDHHFPFDPRPKILQYVADRDTWTWEMPYSEEVNAYLYTIEQSVPAWDRMERLLWENFEYVLDHGSTILKYRDQMVRDIVANHTTVSDWFDIEEKVIPFVVAPVLHSEVGHELLKMYPDAPFSMTYMDNEGERKYSLRSEDHRTDVGALAKLAGGGGHHNAAGFSRPLTEVWEKGYRKVIEAA